MQGPARLSGFVVAYTAFDLFMCFIRLLMAALAGVVLVAPHVAKISDALRYTGPSEFITALGVGLFGILANSMILAKKPAGVTLGWIALGFTVMSIGVGVWQSSIKINGFFGDDAYRIGMVIGAGMTLVIRLVLVSVYGIVLAQAKASLEPSDDFSTYAY